MYWEALQAFKKASSLMNLGIQKKNFLPLCHVSGKIPPSAWPFIGPRRRWQLAVIVGASCPVQFPRHYSRNSYDKLYRVLGCAKLPSPLPRGRKNQSSTFLCLHHNTKAIEMFASVMNLKFFIFLDTVSAKSTTSRTRKWLRGHRLQIWRPLTDFKGTISRNKVLR